MLHEWVGFFQRWTRIYRRIDVRILRGKKWIINPCDDKSLENGIILDTANMFPNRNGWDLTNRRREQHIILDLLLNAFIHFDHHSVNLRTT